jgi:CRISPR-associated endonuclease/helicase Cas3
MVDLYPYQRTVKHLIQSGQSVILQAPTGAGKTRAALAPFIETFFDFEPHQFPRKCIYSVPMRTLANQFNAEYAHLAASYKRKFGRDMNVTIQTGERPEDSKLEGDLIFTTIDQTLSSFLCIPYALSTRQANINAGAIVSSYLVFDEFHLFPPEAFETTVAMLKLLKGLTPFLLMTATFSDTMLKDLSRQLGAAVIPNQQYPARFEALPSQQKERRYQPVDALLTAAAVLAFHPVNGRSIAVCNTVSRAQNLYDELKEQVPDNIQIKLLHSRFYKEDRSEKETWLRREFGKDKERYTVKSAILVATQVVEVGLDITSDVFHTDLAPANAILQRAGRCARYKGESGQIFIYQLPVEEDNAGNPRKQYAPYHTHGQDKICELTWQEFHKWSRQNLSFSDEQAIITVVHNPTDATTLRQIAENRHIHREMMQSAMGYQERGLAARLIRNVNNRNVIVHPDPNSDTHEDAPERLKNPWRFQNFSLFLGSVHQAYRKVTELAETIGHDDWTMMVLHQQNPEVLEEWEQGEPEHIWRPVQDNRQLDTALLVVVHPRLATYSAETGFQIGVANDQEWVVKERSSPPGRNDKRYTYRQETYLEHIAGLYQAYREPQPDKTANGTPVRRLPLHADMAYIFARFEADPRFKLSAGLCDKLARYTIAGHDLGKLGQGWQRWVHQWQAAIGRPVSADIMLAHTDFDGTETQQQQQKKLTRQIGPRPPHAAESAYCLRALTVAVTGKNVNLFRMLNSAIACHHAATHRGGLQAFKADKQARVAFDQAMRLVGLDDLPIDPVQWAFDNTASLSKHMVEPEQMARQMLPYFVFARILRLTDQRSQQ